MLELTLIETRRPSKTKSTVPSRSTRASLLQNFSKSALLIGPLSSATNRCILKLFSGEITPNSVYRVSGGRLPALLPVRPGGRTLIIPPVLVLVRRDELARVDHANL